MQYSRFSRKVKTCAAIPAKEYVQVLVKPMLH
jgi:hypothetical protein